MQLIKNPFVTSGYLSAEYFCDRQQESKRVISDILNGNNIAIISTRRMGKTGLIQHCFHSKELSKGYYKFYVDIYATKSLRDFVFSLSKVILEELKPFGKKAMGKFVDTVLSLQMGITFDVAGKPFFNVRLGDIRNIDLTLDEIFSYLSSADKPCIVAIDEFQQITSYPEKNVEALLRTHVQRCNNANFIFAGSRRHTMGNMFLSASRPFYQSVSMLSLEHIEPDSYTDFARKHFNKAKKDITPETITTVYERFKGVTWYIQKILNVLYTLTPVGETCDISVVGEAVTSTIDTYKYAYQEILFRLPAKQKELLIAIAKEGGTHAATSGEFVKKNGLTSASSVQSALRGLIEKDFVTVEAGSYYIYDQFLDCWIRDNL